METEVLKFNDDKITDSLKRGEVVSFPTETVYGLGVIYNQEKAFEKLVQTKRRKPDQPFTLMLGNKKEIKKYASFSDKTEKIIDKFMPGEITILLRPKENLYPWVTLSSKYIGIRVPNSKDVCELINKVGEPLLVTSANISGEPVCQTFEEVYDKFNEKVAIIVEGKTDSKLPSTIVVCDEELVLIREGGIPFSIIKEEWERS